jgi:predicted metal-dependent phosphoesterase TrpH
LTPFEIVAASKKAQLHVISVTDHDTISGVEETIECAEDQLEVIPAVEMSSNIGLLDVHILGYYIDCNDGELLEYLEDFKKHRTERVKKIITNLSQDGIKLEFEQIRNTAKNCSLGRPHIAEVLVENGYVKSINEAFARYLGYRSPYYEPKKDIHPKEAIKKIKQSCGIPVLAHPGTLGDEQLIYQLIMDGIQGIEVWHPDHTHAWQGELYEIALKNGLVMTGGSDCHGRRIGTVLIGTTGCGCQEVENLKQHKENIEVLNN